MQISYITFVLSIPSIILTVGIDTQLDDNQTANAMAADCDDELEAEQVRRICEVNLQVNLPIYQ